MFKGKRLLTSTGIFTGIFAVSFGAAFFSQYKPNTSFGTTEVGQEEEEIKPETDKQKVLNSLLSIKGFEVTGDLTMIAKDNTTIGVGLTGQGDLTDLEDIKIKGDIDISINYSHLRAGFGYFEDELFFDYNNNYFKLETTKLLDFVKMLPTNFDIGVELPTEIEEMDLSLIESYFDDMSDKQLTPDGQNYYFTINLSENIALYVVTDLDLNFSGLRTGTIDYNGMIFKLNVSLERRNDIELISPKYTEDYEKYQDFAPALKLFDGLYALTQENKNTINADLDIRKYEEGESEAETILKTNLDFTYNLEGESKLFGLNGKVISSKTNANNETVDIEVPYSFALANKRIYAHYGDIAFSVSNDSLTAMLQYVLDRVGGEKIQSIFNGLTDTMSTSKLGDIVSKANNLLGSIRLTGDELGINLNTSNFSTTKVDEETGDEVDDLTLSNLYVDIRFDSVTGALESISIKNFSINSYEADLVLTFGEYKEFSLDNVDYQNIDHLTSIVTFYDTYKDISKFRIEFDANITKENENDITVDGGLQFELDPLREQEGHINVGYGYGQVDITDRKNVTHSIKADMKSVDELLLSYKTITGTSRDNNVDPMNVKMKVQTMKDIADIAGEIIRNPDDHFEEIIGNVFETTGTLPIEEIIAGDYLQLLTTNLIDRFEAGPDYVEFDIALDVLSLEGTSFTVRIEFGTGEYGIETLETLRISNLSFEGLNIEFNAYLKAFDDSLESSRLLPSEATDYIDFSDLKVLLQLGVNTSKSNYYHFNATASVGISLFSISIPVDLDIKVWTLRGDVKVSIDIKDIPTIVGVNGKLTSSNRQGHIYYHDKMFYVERTETYSGLEKVGEKTVLGVKVPIYGYRTHDIDYVAKYNVSDFFNNAIEILCKDIICLEDNIMDKIYESIDKTSDPNYLMKYENILNDFVYSKSGHYFFFDVNLAEIANNPQLEKFTVKVLTDNSDTVLTGLDVYLSIKLTSVLSIILDAKITLADSSLVADSSNNLTAVDTLESRLAGYGSGYEYTFDSIR